MRNRTGETVARVLAGGWRPARVPLKLSPAELDAALPILLGTGAAGIAWRRLSGHAAESPSITAPLQEAHRHHRLQSALLERELIDALEILREVGVEPLLAKGWAVAGYYAERSLRPFVDLDLFFRHEDVGAAVAALFSVGEAGPPVDVHSGLGRWGDRKLDAVLERSREVPIGSTVVRVPCEEDHLRMLCLHLWGHNAWRPLWLCDIAALVEGMTPSFDWNLCLEGSERYRRWIGCAVGLAREVLEARIDHTPFRDTRLPTWLHPALLRKWGRSLERTQADPLRPRLRHLVIRPRALLQELRTHWPDPIEVTFAMDRPIDSAPRVWYQLGAVLKRVPHLLHREEQGRQPSAIRTPRT